MSDGKFFDVMVKQLCTQIASGNHCLTELPLTVRAILGENRFGVPMWRERIDINRGTPIQFDDFKTFVETPPTAGLGASIDMLKKVCQGDNVAIDMLDREVQRPVGNPDFSIRVNHPNRKRERDQQDRSTKSLRRLRKDRPDLHEKVLADEMTVNEAMVEADFYPPRIAINLKSAESAAATIRNNAPPEFVAELRRLLNE